MGPKGWERDVTFLLDRGAAPPVGVCGGEVLRDPSLVERQVYESEERKRERERDSWLPRFQQGQEVLRLMCQLRPSCLRERAMPRLHPGMMVMVVTRCTLGWPLRQHANSSWFTIQQHVDEQGPGH